MTNRQGRTYQNQKEEIILSYDDGQYIMKQARSKSKYADWLTAKSLLSQESINSFLIVA